MLILYYLTSSLLPYSFDCRLVENCRDERLVENEQLNNGIVGFFFIIFFFYSKFYATYSFQDFVKIYYLGIYVSSFFVFLGNFSEN